MLHGGRSCLKNTDWPYHIALGCSALSCTEQRGWGTTGPTAELAHKRIKGTAAIVNRLKSILCRIVTGKYQKITKLWHIYHALAICLYAPSPNPHSFTFMCYSKMHSGHSWAWRSFLCGEGQVRQHSLWFGIRFKCWLQQLASCCTGPDTTKQKGKLTGLVQEQVTVTLGLLFLSGIN